MTITQAQKQYVRERAKNWDEHFVIQEDSSLSGQTPEARTTIVVLRINDALRVKTRCIGLQSGDYPCYT